MTLLDIPKDLQIIISNYEPKFAIFFDNPDWRFLIRQNFSLEFATDVPAEELRALYIESCTRDKSIFAYYNYVFIMLNNKIFEYGCHVSAPGNDTSLKKK